MFWYHAKDNCAELNANLVAIHSRNEMTFLEKLAERSKSIEFWAGGKLAAGVSLKDTDGSSFVWVDKSKFDFENWGIQKPSGDGSCLKVLWTLNTSLWSDAGCRKQRLAYICQKPLPGMYQERYD